MASYRLSIKPSAAKEIEALPKNDRIRVIKRIKGLSENPRPPGCEKLSGHDKYRVRQGKYRIVYSVSDEELIVLVVKVLLGVIPIRRPAILASLQTIIF